MFVIVSGFFQRQLLYRAFEAVSTRCCRTTYMLTPHQRQIGLSAGDRQCGRYKRDMVICAGRATRCDWVRAGRADERRRGAQADGYC